MSEETPEVDPRQVVEDRLLQLKAKRVELEEQLKRDLEAAMAPLDTSIKELQWVLAQMGGPDAAAQDYNLVRRQRPSPAGVAPPTQGTVYPFQPHAAAAQARDAPPEVVKSPKTGQSVPTNAALLKRKIQGG